MPARNIMLLAWRLLAGPPHRAGGGTTGRGRARLVGAILGVSLSVIPLVVVQQMAEGMIAGIADRFIETGSYHLQAVPRATEQGDVLTETADRIAAVSGVVHVTPERRGFGLLYSDSGRSGVTIRAVPQAWWSDDPRVRELIEVEQGAFDLEADAAIVLGTEVAEQLAASPGSEVRLLTVRPLGEGRVLPRVSRFTVAGIVSTGYRDLDRLWIFVELDRGRRIIPDETARDLLGIKVDDPRALPNPLFGRGLRSVAVADARTRMAETVDGVLAVLDPTWFVYDWYAAEQGRYVSFLTSRNLLAVVMAMIVIVAVISVSAALVLLVIEKEDDIAVLRATGVSSRTITAAFISAGLIIAGAGALIGTGIGILIALWINEVLAGLEVALSWVTGQAVDIINSDFYLQQIPVEIDWVSVAGSIALVLVAALFAAFIPARRAARILPDRVLRRHVR